MPSSTILWFIAAVIGFGVVLIASILGKTSFGKVILGFFQGIINVTHALYWHGEPPKQKSALSWYDPKNSTLVCHFCRTENESDAQFCKRCGAPIRK